MTTKYIAGCDYLDRIISAEPHRAVVRNLVQVLERAERHQGKRWLTRSREENRRGEPGSSLINVLDCRTLPAMTAYRMNQRLFAGF